MSQTLEIDIEQRREIAAAVGQPRQIERPTKMVHQPEMQKKPRLGCAGLVRRGDALLLGKRNKEPNRGLWVLPGGGVEFGEKFIKTLEREVWEEAGVHVDVEGIFNVYELITPPDEHRVIIYVKAVHRSGEPVPSSDLSEVRFFTREELQEMSRRKLISPLVEKVLREAAFI